jgi:hypothetical protein
MSAPIKKENRVLAHTSKSRVKHANKTLHPNKTAKGSTIPCALSILNNLKNGFKKLISKIVDGEVSAPKKGKIAPILMTSAIEANIIKRQSRKNCLLRLGLMCTHRRLNKVIIPIHFHYQSIEKYWDDFETF